MEKEKDQTQHQKEGVDQEVDFSRFPLVLNVELDESALEDVEVMGLSESMAESSRERMDIGRELEPTSVNLELVAVSIAGLSHGFDVVVMRGTGVSVSESRVFGLEESFLN